MLFHSACAFLVTFHKGAFFTTLVILSVGTLSSGVRYAMLTRPKQLSIAANILSSVFLVVLGLVPSTIVAFVCFLWLTYLFTLLVELFFCKKIPLSRCVEYVMDGSMDHSVS